MAAVVKKEFVAAAVKKEFDMALTGVSSAWNGIQLAVVVFSLFACSAESYPFHASCKLQW